MKSLEQSPVKLLASANAVIAQFHRLPYAHRITNIVERVASLPEEEADAALEAVRAAFAHRHHDIDAILQRNHQLTEAVYGTLPGFSPRRCLLLGAFLTKEYSFQAAALFNPSIVPHPDQDGLPESALRFILSLRATGEGHISSIAFRTGVLTKTGEIVLEAATGLFTPLEKDASAPIDNIFGNGHPGTDELFNRLPASVTATNAIRYLEEAVASNDLGQAEATQLADLLDTNYNLLPAPGIRLDETVIFPSARCESMGMEDLRLVRFGDGNEVTYYGTYTAYNGREIRTQLLETTDFKAFRIRTFAGAAINDKGMALFPEKVGGRFAMISRQGSELLSIMFSDDLYRWERFEVLLHPQFDWEFVQMGNCGSPVKTDKGWLLLTHGVGAMRKYVISAILLDLHDPSKVIARLHKPLLQAAEGEREGYVPNVVYTCGMILHNGLLLIPYAVSDAATVFATVRLDEVLNEMKPYQP